MSLNPIILYDGVCGLCNRFVRCTLRHDDRDFFRFASLQSPVAAEILARHGASAADLDTLYVVTQPGQSDEQIYSRSEAVAFVLDALGGVWRVCGAILKLLPRPLRDALYNLVARRRYRIFGKFEACPLPDPRHRHKFMDQ